MLHALKGILMIPDAPHAHHVAKNLLDSFDMMWRFVENSEIDLTNNLAERQIRKYVIYRKKSFLPGLKGSMNLWRGFYPSS